MNFVWLTEGVRLTGHPDPDFKFPVKVLVNLDQVKRILHRGDGGSVLEFEYKGACMVVQETVDQIIPGSGLTS